MKEGTDDFNRGNDWKVEVWDMDALSGTQTAGYLHGNGKYCGRLNCSEIRSTLC